MKKLIAIWAVGCFLGLGALAYAADMGPSGSPTGGAAAAAAEKAASSPKEAGARTVSGEILKIEGENYVVKDETGKEVKLHVNTETKKEGTIKVGDKIEAQADASGHATSIKAAKGAAKP